KAPGKAPTLGPEARAALARAVEEGPTPWRDGVRWRLINLVQWLRDKFGLSVSETTVGRELRAMGLRKLSARPRHHAPTRRGSATTLARGTPALVFVRPSWPLLLGAALTHSVVSRNGTPGECRHQTI